ncbi:pseudouridylate synthase [Crocinitomicaceae bacterium CZZ-1]|uniref:tRNA pseudouridine synthase C n=1 Tax=Taishania pollutisoli TaxID=2766479 RepID=A0A8J6TSF8_9FLAO|nr:pseudouridine synthase [Taishania pollutisoli]MBC9811214.1 pseudouridylate synthase [Taishania pollutisoli]MBX2947870.1 pseudouridylate synthase [Crocinitomicaceae bacterium]
MTHLEIVYQDEHIVAINKPHGLLVHQSPIARDAEEFALQLLRDQLGRTVYPAHRLDRKTAGILLFSLDKETDRIMQQKFQNREIDKKYLALLRGYAPAEQTIDYPLKKEDGTIQDAVTHFKTLEYFELPIPFGKHPSSRYSLVEAAPETGRMHQLRRHFAHIFHPIIGDRPHGCNKQNKFWLEHFQMNTMLLHASELTFNHPHTYQKIELKAPVSSEFERVLVTLSKK